MNSTNMSARTSSDSTIVILRTMRTNINIWLGTFLLIMGNIGCVGNLLIYRSTLFRRRAYTIYLVFQSFSDFVVLNFILLTRIIEKGFDIPVKTVSVYICKSRQFAEYYFYLCSFTFFTLASIDRILSTQRSNAYRKWSNRVSLARKLVIISSLFWFSILVHRAIVYTLEDDDCDPPSEFYDIIDQYLEAILLNIFPLTIVFLLVYLLRRSLKNTLQRRTNMVPVSIQQHTIKQSQFHHIDSQLTLMLLLQAIIAIVSFLPYGCRLLYDVVTERSDKTSLQESIDDVIGQFTKILSFTFFSSSFHISILSSRGFRREIKHLFQINKIHSSMNGTVNTATQRLVE
ncbi:hypothetical protein I4U23_022509 [Adineta vaga]|nr:hypothetical protein I4U23_022509 [Adineta vaga]